MLILASLVTILLARFISADEVLGCGGFVKSHVPIDFSKVIIKLYTKQGIIKDETACAPNNGYYFIPIYDKGEYNLQLESPLGWTFEPVSVTIVMDGKTDLCSQGQDINFVFKGFGIAGRVGSIASSKGPAGVTVELISTRADTPVRSTTTTTDGSFFFTLVYPGDYDIRIVHPHWKISKSQVKIHVSESDTQLPVNSLMVAGYDVNGVFSGEGGPTPGVHFLLYSQNQKAKDIFISDCETANIGPVANPTAFLCYVTSNTDGRFRFPSVPTGSYIIVPQYARGRPVYFSPESMEFNVNQDTVHLTQPFQIVAFSLSGRVQQIQAGPPLNDAKVFFNDEYVGTTNSDGLYHVERVKAGPYKIHVTHDEFEFDPVHMALTHSKVSSALDTIYPARYRVCGSVSSELPQTIAITQVGSTQHVAMASEPSTGVFCHFLRPGQYQFEILDNNRLGDQFYPRTQMVDVGLLKTPAIIFTQLKAVVQGAVRCFPKLNDCANIKAILRPTNTGQAKSRDRDHSQEVIQHLQNGTYKFFDIRPGTYTIYLTSNRLCWNIQEQDIVVTSFEYNATDFVQTGYSISILSSHDTLLKYQQKSEFTATKSKPSDDMLNVLGNKPTTHCLSSPGTYTFTPYSCHGYNPTSYTINTNDPHSIELVLNAVSHALTGHIRSEHSTAQDALTVDVKAHSDDATPYQLTLEYKENTFPFAFQLAPGERLTLAPISYTFLFTPALAILGGTDDCLDVGEVIVAKRGKLYAGQVEPGLANVEIMLSSGNHESEWKTMTDTQGKYRFPPVPNNGEYTLSAHKESYVMTGPDKNGHFHAHKLAEVHVRVLDQRTEQPLQGSLVSLSGGESYRRNLQTDVNGFVTFQSLSPSEYFLRPVMKEYSFEPPSQMINVAEGATVNINLTGRRVAYSAYGMVTSLNSDPEEDVTVIATGKGNCSQYSEESSSEANGSFRIRGLLPWCQYELRVHSTEAMKIAMDENPVKVNIYIQSSDVRGIRLIAFRPCTSTEFLVSISTTSVVAMEQMRGNIYLKVVRPDGNAAYSAKVDLTHGETLVYVPAVPMDGTTYTICADTYQQHCGQEETEHAATLVANTSFHFVRLVPTGAGGRSSPEYTTTTPAKPPTSYALLALVIVLACACAAYNMEWVERSGLAAMDGVVSYLRPRRSDADGKTTAPPMEPIDTSDIDQIVQSINANTKRRVIKPRRI